MPNWVTSSLTIHGENAEEILNKLLVEDEDTDDEVSLDFNKIIPMSEELKIVAGSVTDNCISIYLSTLSPNQAKSKEKSFINSSLFPELKFGKSYIKSPSEIEELVNSNISKIVRENNEFNPMEPVFYSKEELVKYGKQAIDNIKKYGSKDWYDWSVKNWGTKWNACHTYYCTGDSNSVLFDTAWSDVRPLIKELSKQYPNNSFEYHYSEEQIGLYAGYAVFKNGEAIEDVRHPEYSKEAYDESFELWGDGCKEYYKFDEKTNTYKSIDDEEDGGME